MEKQDVKNKLIMLWKQCCDSDELTTNEVREYYRPIDFEKGEFNFFKNTNVEYAWGKGGKGFKTESGNVLYLFKVEFRLYAPLEYHTEVFKGFFKNKEITISDIEEYQTHYFDNYDIQSFDKRQDNIRIACFGHFISYKKICELLLPDEYNNLLKYENDKNVNLDINDLNSELKLLTPKEYKEFLKYKEQLKDEN